MLCVRPHILKDCCHCCVSYPYSAKMQSCPKYSFITSATCPFYLTSHLDLLSVPVYVEGEVFLSFCRGGELAEGGSVASTMLHSRVVHSKLLHCVSK